VSLQGAAEVVRPVLTTNEHHASLLYYSAVCVAASVWL